MKIKAVSLVGRTTTRMRMAVSVVRTRTAHPTNSYTKLRFSARLQEPVSWLNIAERNSVKSGQTSCFRKIVL